MMGKKTLSEIKKDIQARFAEQDFDLPAWCAEELRKLKGTARVKSRDIETLELLRDALRKSTKGRGSKKGRRATA